MVVLTTAQMGEAHRDARGVRVRGKHGVHALRHLPLQQQPARRAQRLAPQCGGIDPNSWLQAHQSMRGLGSMRMMLGEQLLACTKPMRGLCYPPAADHRQSATPLC